MLIDKRVEYIVNWIKNYSENIKYSPATLVIGVSGGIDSAVTSTLAAKTKIRTIAVSMPIRQNDNQHDLSLQHLDWLKKEFNNVETKIINLNNVFLSFEKEMENFDNKLAFANSRSRLRMITLYQIAQSNRGLVIGTGNKVEDFGVGFFTKYGDGGVDISPIADCTKTEIWEIGKELGIEEEIIKAQPTDGLWDDGRTDVGQLGLSYKDLEEAMVNPNSLNRPKYESIRKLNLHKMDAIPVCKIPK